MKKIVKNKFSKFYRSRTGKRMVFYVIICFLPVLQFCLFTFYVNFNSIKMAFETYDYASGANGSYGVDGIVKTFAGFNNFKMAWQTLVERNYMIKNSLWLFLSNWIQKFHFSGMYFFVYYAFYEGLSDAYSEAAEIDGASQFKILLHIIIPLSMKMIGSVMLIQFINLWNDYQTPLLYLPTKPTLAYSVYLFMAGQGDGVLGFPNNLKTNYPLQTAACMVLAVPVLIIYCAFNKKLLGDISMGGIKG